MSIGLHSRACCLPAKVLLLRISNTYCIAFPAGSWRSGPLEVGLANAGCSWVKGILWEPGELHSDWEWAADISGDIEER